MRGGAVMLWGGLACLIGGAVAAVCGPFPVGFAVAILGAVGLSVGACLLAEPWSDSVDREIDRWERDWTARWSPECPVHGENLCYTRTRRCPATRDRISV